jgi:hypothetical protein
MFRANHITSYISKEILTSIPTWRETHRAEKNNKYFDFKQLKLYTQIDIFNLLSMTLFFSSFSIRIQFIVKKFVVTGILLIVPLIESKAILAILPCFIMIIGLSSNFGATARRYY